MSDYVRNAAGEQILTLQQEKILARVKKAAEQVAHISACLQRFCQQKREVIKVKCLD